MNLFIIYSIIEGIGLCARFINLFIMNWYRLTLYQTVCQLHEPVHVSDCVPASWACSCIRLSASFMSLVMQAFKLSWTCSLCRLLDCQLHEHVQDCVVYCLELCPTWLCRFTCTQHEWPMWLYFSIFCEFTCTRQVCLYLTVVLFYYFWLAPESCACTWLV